MKYALNPTDRFWKYVVKTDGCWLWQGQVNVNGYGRLALSYHPKTVRIAAHRYSWQLHHGPIPKGMLVCHDCPGGDNRLCVNPDHLFLGTSQDNEDDKVAKGRQAKGPTHWMSLYPEKRLYGSRNPMVKHPERHPQIGKIAPNRKWTPELEANVRALRDQGFLQKDIAASLGISQSFVSDILCGKKRRQLNP